MNIYLTPHFESIVKNKVESGLYNSANEVIYEALRLLEERDQLHLLQIKTLKHDIQDGINSGEATQLNIEAIKILGQQRIATQQHSTD